MAGDDLVELKFRLYDGTDIGPNNYPPATTVANLKESILAQWPSGNILICLGNLVHSTLDLKSPLLNQSISHLNLIIKYSTRISSEKPFMIVQRA